MVEISFHSHYSEHSEMFLSHLYASVLVHHTLALHLHFSNKREALPEIQT